MQLKQPSDQVPALYGGGLTAGACGGHSPDPHSTTVRNAGDLRGIITSPGKDSGAVIKRGLRGRCSGQVPCLVLSRIGTSMSVPPSPQLPQHTVWEPYFSSIWSWVLLPSRLELGLERSMVWWCSPGDSPGLKMGPRRISCSMRWGWCSLKGSFPDTMAWRMIPLGTQLLQGVVPPKAAHGPFRGGWGTHRLHRSACSPLYFLLMRISGAV